MQTQVDMRLGPAGDNAVQVNGQDITHALSSVTLQQDNTGRVPTLTFHLYCPTVTVAGQMRVLLSEDTQSLLLGLGWTPPAS